jgi:cytochrome c
MDEFEYSKVGGAVIAALLLMFAPKILGNLNGGHKGAHGEMMAGYALPVAKATEVKAEAGGAPEAAFDAAAVLKLLAAAKPEAGEAIFKRCATCHANDKAAKSGTGPNLWGLVGRKKGSQADYSGYSDVLKGKGGEWVFADLAAFLHNSKGWLPGTKMNINIAEPAELADLLAYLRTLSDSPVALP